MQLINDTPVANSQPVALTTLKLRDIVVLAIGIGGHFLDLLHNPPLPVHWKPGQRFGKGFCGDDCIHESIVTLGNIIVKREMLPKVTMYFNQG